MSQIATSNDPTAPAPRGGRRKLPFAFTEHGALQAASVLNSPRAAEVSIYIVRAFVQLRGLLSANEIACIRAWIHGLAAEGIPDASTSDAAQTSDAQTPDADAEMDSAMMSIDDAGGG